VDEILAPTHVREDRDRERPIIPGRLVEQQTRPKGTVTDGMLQEIIRRVVEAAKPERIILFGSAARGEMGLNSDVDLLVVRSGVHRRRLAMEIYRRLSGVGCPVDVVVVTPEDIERFKDSPALIIHTALKEGRAVYAA